MYIYIYIYIVSLEVYIGVCTCEYRRQERTELSRENRVSPNVCARIWFSFYGVNSQLEQREWTREEIGR